MAKYYGKHSKGYKTGSVGFFGRVKARRSLKKQGVKIPFRSVFSKR